jgi:hypothetical protein
MQSKKEKAMRYSALILEKINELIKEEDGAIERELEDDDENTECFLLAVGAFVPGFFIKDWVEGQDGGSVLTHNHVINGLILNYMIDQNRELNNHQP